jgi:hypothetical protein
MLRIWAMFFFAQTLIFHALSIWPENPKFYYVHVGKAGGSTCAEALHVNKFMPRTEEKALCLVNVSCSMKNVKDAGDSLLKGKSALERRIFGGMHVWNTPEEVLMNFTNVFLFSVRDPIARLVSAYNYYFISHINFRKGKDTDAFQNCFSVSGSSPNFDILIDTLRTHETTPNCRTLGLQMLTGTGASSLGIHFARNYHFYMKNTVEKKTDHAVAVIRSDYLWEDIIRLDQYVGGNGHFVKKGTKKNYFPGEMGNFSHVSVSNSVFLCCLLYEELHYYQQLILKAVNLDDLQKRDTLYPLLNRCQMTASHTYSFRNFREENICAQYYAISDITGS